MIDYYVKSEINLSIESYTSEGLDQNALIDELNNTKDLYCSSTNYSARAGINYNVLVSTSANNDASVRVVVNHVESIIFKLMGKEDGSENFNRKDFINTLIK